MTVVRLQFLSSAWTLSVAEQHEVWGQRGKEDFKITKRAGEQLWALWFTFHCCDCWFCAEQHLFFLESSSKLMWSLVVLLCDGQPPLLWPGALLASWPASPWPSSSAEFQSKLLRTSAGAAARWTRLIPPPSSLSKNISPAPLTARRPAGSLIFLVLYRAHPSKTNK